MRQGHAEASFGHSGLSAVRVILKKRGKPLGNELIQISHAGGPPICEAGTRELRLPVEPRTAAASGKTFYIETFGCQMNVHDSEKVAGTLIARGYRPVETREEADLILYNTCSIREKAAEKVFSRLGTLKKAYRNNPKVIGVLGCVAQQEGERIFERAPQVSLVCGSASYTKLPDLLEQLEAGNRRVTGLDLDTDECFETELTRRDNPFRAYLTIIEGCDKRCAYCVVPMTRGPERSRPSDKILAECRRLVDEGYTEIQLLGQIVNSWRGLLARTVEFCGAAGTRGGRARRPARALHHLASALFHAGNRAGHRLPSRALRSDSPAGAVGLERGAGAHAARLHARGVSGKNRLHPPRQACY